MACRKIFMGLVNFLKLTNEPHHDKTNKMAYTPSEDSDQPGHLPCLVRVSAWAHAQSDQGLRCPLEETLGRGYPLSAQRRL